MNIIYVMCFLGVVVGLCLMIWGAAPRREFIRQLMLENNKILRLLAIKQLGIDEEELDKLLKEE